MIELVQKGGYLMYPLIACSLIALAIVIEKLINLRRKKVLRPKKATEIEELIEEEEYGRAKAICRSDPWPYSRIILKSLENNHLRKNELKELIVDWGRKETSLLEKYLGSLGTIASISPLLGLLGTVVGMIKVFNVISTIGVGQAAALSEGISEALITTATGLSIAIPALIFHNYFRDKAESLVMEMESRSRQILKKLKFGKSEE